MVDLMGIYTLIETNQFGGAKNNKLNLHSLLHERQSASAIRRAEIDRIIQGILGQKEEEKQEQEARKRKENKKTPPRPQKRRRR